MPRGIGGFFNGSQKECTDCGEIKSTDDFHPVSRGTKTPGRELMSSDFRNRCKPCRNRNTINRQIEKKLERFPTLYWECDECDQYNHRRLDKCRRCGGGKK